MTYLKYCINCGCRFFVFDPRNYLHVTLHEHGGIIPMNEQELEVADAHKFDHSFLYDSPEQVTCVGCGLEVERARLDPNYDWNDPKSEFKICIHEPNELEE